MTAKDKVYLALLESILDGVRLLVMKQNDEEVMQVYNRYVKATKAMLKKFRDMEAQNAKTS